MTTEYFRVRNGLAVGEDKFTVEAATGNTQVEGSLVVTGDLSVDNINVSGNTIISTDTNGNITLTPNGTGNVALSLSNGGNLTNTRNYVFGAIRNSTTDGLGDIWALNVASAITPTRGISIDNSVDTSKTASYLARTYGAAAGNRSRLIFERARGTAASPLPVLSGDFLGEVDVTGYSSTGWLNDTLSVVPGFFGFTATQDWISNTALGTGFSLSLAPTSTPIASPANLVGCLAVSPQTFASRSDAFTWANGKTGTTQTMALDVSGNLTITGDLRVNGNDIRSSDNTSQIVMSSAGATLELRGNNIQLENAAGSALTSAGISYTRTYGEFAYTAATVTIAAQDTVYAFPLDTTLSSSGTSISNTSRVNISVSGYYKIIMSLQCAMETNSVGQFDFWLRKNGVDVANSATQVDLLKDQKAVISMDWLVESDGNDYWEIMYASNSANYANLDFPFIPAWTTPTNAYDRPAAPVILVNVIPAGM